MGDRERRRLELWSINVTDRGWGRQRRGLPEDVSRRWYKVIESQQYHVAYDAHFYQLPPPLTMLIIASILPSLALPGTSTCRGMTCFVPLNLLPVILLREAIKTLVVRQLHSPRFYGEYLVHAAGAPDDPDSSLMTAAAASMTWLYFSSYHAPSETNYAIDLPVDAMVPTASRTAPAPGDKDPNSSPKMRSATCSFFSVHDVESCSPHLFCIWRWVRFDGTCYAIHYSPRYIRSPDSVLSHSNPYQVLDLGVQTFSARQIAFPWVSFSILAIWISLYLVRRETGPASLDCLRTSSLPFEMINDVDPKLNQPSSSST
ncbi:hypothetical protein SODALDRAFT_377749 [Sodiomyces alkalinus F11]|uniref:Uncharacterized protein n=1 Tax=Sodiomyces alkalinus (strain CBS 110278 / VKM F-3762 / F11) TaxID=1314773 RepID=A0A3N2PZ73_SODAK|nr:hypothetical protein SODALDRAFT_377749 [Sodiomyces alkalinus F11]ROT39833.1 hypothetical protein SODALDRAFT_377749 [Sodiomyces alkalinus F11]